MANLFDVYNDGLSIDHAEGEKLESGETPITISGLTADTTYDKVQVAYAGSYNKSDVPSFKTKFGRNLYLNSRVLSDGYGTNGNVTVTVEPFDSTTNMWHLVAAQGAGVAVGIYIFNYANGKIPNNSDWSYSVNIKGIGNIITLGLEGSDVSTIRGIIGNNWSRISQTGHVNEPNFKTLVMYFNTTDSPLDVYIKLPKLELGNVATDWTPAPEDAIS